MNNRETTQEGIEITWSRVLLIHFVFFKNQFSHEQLWNRKATEFVH